MLRQFLTARFDAVPEQVVQRIESCTDLDRLMAAAPQVLRLDTPEDLGMVQNGAVSGGAAVGQAFQPDSLLVRLESLTYGAKCLTRFSSGWKA